MKTLLTLIVSLGVTLSAHAGLAQGTWKQYPVFGQTVSKVVDTPDITYFTTSGTLHARYHKGGGETRDFISDLSDNQVKDMWYNQDGKYLFIAYQNANIDLLYDDGKVINMPDIKDAALDVDKTINSANFFDNKIYVGTAFGLVIFDDQKQQVLQSGVYNQPVTGVSVTGNSLYMASGPSLYRVAADGRINAMANYTMVLTKSKPIDEVRTLDRQNGNVLIRTYDGVSHHKLTENGNEVIGRENQYWHGSPFIDGKDGAVYFTYADNNGVTSVYKVTADNTTSVRLPDQLVGNKFGTWYGPETMLWGADGDGIGCYILGEDGKMTVASEKVRPTDGTSALRVAYFSPSTDGTGFFISNVGSWPTPGAIGTDTGKLSVQGADFYSNGTLSNVDIKEGLEYDYGSTLQSLKSLGVTGGVLAPQFVFNDPDDPSIIYYGSCFEGVYVAKNGKIINKIYGRDDASASGTNNSPISDWFGNRVYGGTIDKDGNLWLYAQPADNIEQHPNRTTFAMLPADKRRNIANIKRSDWIVPKITQLGGVGAKALHCTKSDMVFLTNAVHVMVALNTHGEYSKLGTKAESCDWKSYIDQDGKTIAETVVNAMVEDHDGRVWLATNDGMLELSDPTQATNPNMRVNRIKVPRNDGSNLADYLLDTEVVTAMSVDASNRKWIGTESSGLYLVSPRGDEILEHFTTVNSPLPSNAINSVYADQNSNSVFIGTNYGMWEYSSDSAPARDDYSEVYAYPNPVTPDYSGWITIKNLMANSLVKICDSAMNTIAQMQSEGGMALWDGCNSAGARVPSGVYYVLASSGSDGSSKSGDVVAKIMVIK